MKYSGEQLRIKIAEFIENGGDRNLPFDIRNLFKYLGLNYYNLLHNNAVRLAFHQWRTEGDKFWKAFMYGKSFNDKSWNKFLKIYNDNGRYFLWHMKKNKYCFFQPTSLEKSIINHERIDKSTRQTENRISEMANFGEKLPSGLPAIKVLKQLQKHRELLLLPERTKQEESKKQRKLKEK